MINAIVTIKSGYDEVKFGFQVVDNANGFAEIARKHMITPVEKGNPVKNKCNY